MALFESISEVIRTAVNTLPAINSEPHHNCECTLVQSAWCTFFGMGTCISKDVRARRKETRRLRREMYRRNVYASHQGVNRGYYERYGPGPIGNEETRLDIQKLIRETLDVIRSLVNNDQEPPRSLLKLNMIADEERGWLMVVKSLIFTIPDNDPLGPAVISLFLDECPLPSKETVQTLLVSLNISKELVYKQQMSAAWHKNMCIVLGALAEKMAGSAAVQMFNKKVQGYLLMTLSYGLPFKPTSYQNKLKEADLHQVRIFSLLALEKFAQTRENQLTISNILFVQNHDEPLHTMVDYLRKEDLKNYWFAKQAGFCAQWALDNIFEDSRLTQYSFQTTDTSNINAMLNHSDVSEYLKIGPDGLEARCDVSSFESVRCTFEAVDGVWYYEATVLTSGVMQIGLATKRSRFLNHEGYGIGDDAYSVAYDGCRQLIWYNAKSEKHEHATWKAGDVVGVLLNIKSGYVQFYLNGVPTAQTQKMFLVNRQPNEGVFAAASFMSFQQCRFNFGSKPFRYPPHVENAEVKNFNDHGVLTKTQRTILPKKLRLEQLQKEVVPDHYCTICCAAPSDTQLLPCRHDGFCEGCSLQMEQCPLCRIPIEHRTTINADYSQVTTRSFDLSSSMSMRENNEPEFSGKSSRTGSVNRRDTVVSVGGSTCGTLCAQTQV